MYDAPENIVTQQFIAAFKAGVADGSVRPEIMADERNFRVIAVIYRGFFSRIAMISADRAMREHYNPDQLIEDYLIQVYGTIAQSTMMRKIG